MFAIFVLLYCAVIAYANAVIRPSETLSVMNGEGFIVYLEVPKSFGAIQNCLFRFREEAKVQIDLNATQPIVTERMEYILPFSTTICGVRVNEVSSASAATWMLEAESIFGDTEEGHVKVQVLPTQKIRFETHVQREIGKGTIGCSKHDSYTKHCRINNEAGETWPQCETYQTLRPKMVFYCLMSNWGRMKASNESIFVDIKNTTLSTVSTVEETATNVVLRCQFQDTVYSCQAEMPDRKSEIYIMDGLYNGYYSTYDTMTAKSKCSLEIPKPLQPNEVGLWRIITYGTSSASGCLYYIGLNKTEIIENELKTLEQVKQIKVYRAESNAETNKISEIYCEVPFVIDDCYLRDPNNTVYFPEDFRFQRQRLYGKCSFTNMPVIEGIWTCGTIGRGYEKEVLQDIEVIVKSKYGEVLTPEVKVKRGGDIELMCKSAYEEPIAKCAFIDPQGRVHLVRTVNGIKTAGHVQYFGHGIDHGECGIKITDVNSDDFGEWKCQFIIYSGKLQSTFQMQLVETAFAHATSVGLGVGLTIMFVLILGVVVGTIFYRRRNLSAHHNFVSSDQLNVPSTSAATILEDRESSTNF